MAPVYKRLSTYTPLAASQAAAAWLGAGAAEAARRHLQRLYLALSERVRDSEDRSNWSEESARHLPCSVFDARYKGLTGQATYIDAGICRRARMR
jgi:hypothetical protein